MKNFIYMFLFSAAAVPAFSQITLTQNDVGPINRRVSVELNESNPAAAPGASGANMSWNFGPLGYDYQDTFTFVNPQFTPYASDYPSANIAMVNTTPVYGYSIVDNTAFRMIGQADAFSSGLYIYKYLKPETILKFPLTYQSAFKDTSATLMQMYMGFDPGIGSVVDSFRSITTTYKDIVADGYGSLTTDFGTTNALRLNNMQYVETVSEYYLNGAWIPAAPTTLDSSRIYTWWANGIGAPLLELTEDLATNTITEALVVTGTQTILGAVEISGPAALNVYPNPANNELHIAGGTNEYEVELLDLQGRTMIREKATAELYTLDLSAVPAGMYMLRVNEYETGKIRSEKIVIEH
jgi:hypothetical protein